MKRIRMERGTTARGLAFAIGLAVAVVVACGPEHDDQGSVGSTREELRTNPDVSTFAIYASNSLEILDRGNVQGGDVGVENASSGPFLVTGFEAALTADSKIDMSHDLLADQVSLRDRATVGDVEATHITTQNNPVYAHQYAFPTMPAPPAPDTAAPSGTAFTVSNGQTQTMSAGAYGAVTVNGTLNLSGGTYDFASLTLNNDSKVEALATTKIRIAGRLSTGDRSHIEVSGSTLTAKDLRVEIDGLNGGSGSPTATPSAFMLGNDTVTRALILAANGTVRTGQRTNATGALFGRDVLVNLDAKVFFEDGFPSCSADGGTCSSNDAGADSGGGSGADSGGGSSSGDAGGGTGADAGTSGGGGIDAGVDAGPTCTPSSCDDGNICTTDTCNGSTCSHALVANGTACSDGNACTVGDACISGTCVPGAGPSIDDGNACTIDACDPSTGVTHTPASFGTSCADGNACNGAETCDGAGSCTPGVPPTVDDGNPCTDDACDPTVGVTHTPRPAGDPACNDNDACNGVEACNGSGACTPGTPPTIDDGNVCTIDGCSPIGGAFHTPVAGCDPTPVGSDSVLEQRASLIGRVVDSTGAGITGATFTVYDERETGTPRSDVSASQANDGSFRIRLTSFPTSEPDRSPIHRLVLVVDAPGRITAHRVTFAHPGDLQDVGSIRLVSRDPAVTNIGPAGGTATDSRGLVQLVVPAGALDTTVPVQITPFDAREDFPAPLPESTITQYGMELWPTGTQFHTPATLRITNSKSVPTNTSIPLGYYNEVTGRWDTLGQATWDGSRFAAQIPHFSLVDANDTAMFDLLMSWSKSPNANDDGKVCPAASSWGSGGGSIAELYPLPTIRAGGEDFGVSLQYDSGLAGSRKLGGTPSTTTGTPAVLPSGSLAVSVSGMKVKTQCVSRGSGGGSATSADGCSGSGVVGSCEGGHAVFAAGLGALGADQSSTLQNPDNAKELGGDASWIEVPLATDGTPDSSSPLARTGLIPQKMSVTSKGAQTCASGGGSFGVADPLNANRFSFLGASGAVAVLTRKVLLHHRFTSPFGSGWAIGEISRAYFDGDHAFVVNGSGQEEEFHPRARLDSAGLAALSTNAAFARDDSTGEHFITQPDGGIYRIDPVSGATTQVALASPLAGSRLVHSLAVAYVGGTRHFIVAHQQGLFDVPQGGTARQVRPSNNNVGRFGAVYVAARGSNVFFSAGDNDPNAAVLYKVDLTADSPAPIAMSMAFGTGDISLGPSAPLGGVSFGAPKGLAFATDGTLYVADSRRNVAYAIRPDGAGTISSSSVVDLVLGDGVGRQANPVGERAPAETFSLNQPTQLAMGEDGILAVSLGYGVASFDPQAKEAEILFDDGGRDEILAVLLDTQNPTPSFLPITKGLMLSTSDASVARVSLDLTSSDRDATRTITHDSSGGATLLDTSSGTLDIFDSVGRQVEHRRRTGKTLYKVEYADSSSDQITRITNAVGAAFTFQYANGKLSSITDPAGGTTSVSINGLGDLISFSQPDGSTNQFEYDAHHLTKKTSPFGDVTTITYNDDGTAATSLRPGGEFHQFAASLAKSPSYNAGGTLSASGTYTDTHGVLHSFVNNDYGDIATDSYTADGVAYVKQSVIPAQLYDSSEPFVARRKNAYQRVSQWTLNGVPLSPPVSFDTFGRVTVQQPQRNDPGGSQGRSHWTFDANGYLTASTSAESFTTQRIERDASGRVTRIYDVDTASGVASGRQSVFTWRSDDQPATTTSHGVTTTFSYDDAGGAGNLISTVDTVGRMMTFGYDPRGNLTSVSDGTATSSSSFDANNRLLRLFDGLGHVTSFSYTNVDCGCSQEDLVTGIDTPDSQHWEFTYGPLGRIASVIDPKGFAESYTYETSGELKSTTDRLERTSSMTHDQLGRVATIVDIAGRKHAMGYPIPTGGTWVGPGLDAASADGSPAGTALTTSLRSGDYQIGHNAYDIEGYPAQITFYRDATFELGYNQLVDNAGRLTHRIDRTNTPITSTTVLSSGTNGTFDDHLMTYDLRTSAPVVSTESSTNATNTDNAVISRNVEFDVTSDTGYGGGIERPSTHAYTLDAAGRITSATNRFFTQPAGDPREVITGPTSSYTYRTDGRVSRIANADGTHDFTYDANGRVSRQDVQPAGTTTETYQYGYDEVGRNTSLTFPDGHVRTQTFDELGRIIQRCYVYPDQPSITDRCYRASYDPVGNVLSLSDPDNTDTIEVDGLDRLARVTRGTYVENYAYNALGALTINANTPIDHQRPRLDGASNADAAVPATLGGQPVTLNKGGRITSMRGTTFDFGTQGYLRSVGADMFTIDPEGRRAWTTYNGLQGYVYEGANRVGDVQHISHVGIISDGVVNQWLYDGVDHPLRMLHSDYTNSIIVYTTIYYEIDLAGSVRRVRGAHGEDLGGYRYTAFGQLLEDTAQPNLDAYFQASNFHDQTLMWKGRPRQILGGTEVYDMRARQWVPELACFSSVDEYAYQDRTSTLWGWAHQNPIKWSDPSGHGPIGTALGAAIGGVLGAQLGFTLGGGTGLVASAGTPAAFVTVPTGAIAGAEIGLIGGGLAGAYWGNRIGDFLSSSKPKDDTDRHPNPGYPEIPQPTGGRGPYGRGADQASGDAQAIENALRAQCKEVGNRATQDAIDNGECDPFKAAEIGVKAENQCLTNAGLQPLSSPKP